MNQLSLFDRPQLPPANATSTSIDAAERIQPHVGRLQRIVLAAIGECGQDGATRAELAERIPMKLQTVCGRCNELLKAKLIYQCDDRRDGGKVLRVSIKKRAVT